MANSKDVVVTGVSTGSSRRADVHANDLEHQQGFNRCARFRARHLVVAGSGPGGPDGPPPHPRVAEIAAKRAVTREDVQLDNALSTPHIGYVARELYRTFYGDTVRNITRWLADGPDLIDSFESQVKENGCPS